jgi:hypothetical protein
MRVSPPVAVPLVLRESPEELLVARSQIGAEQVGDAATRTRELEPGDAPVRRVPLPGDPTPALQGDRKPAHRALLQAEQLAQLVLRHRLDLAQLTQRHHLRQRHLQPCVLVRFQQASEAHEALQGSTQLVIGKRRSRHGCFIQLLPLLWIHQGCSVQQ